MHISLCLLSIMIYLTFATNILGKKNTQNGQGQYSNTFFSCSNIQCRKYNAVVAGSIVGGGILGILILICIIIGYRRQKKRPSQTNVKFVSSKTHNNRIDLFFDANLFQSGIWSYRYLQLGMWHGPCQISLLFDSQFLKITGSGTDSIGMFSIDGTYSMKTGRIALRKSYPLDLGNRLENMTHHIIIQVEWNTEKRLFEGKQFIHNQKYREVNQFELKYIKHQTHLSIMNA